MLRATRAVLYHIRELADRLDELPDRKRIMAYCRGSYCLLADETVSMLRERGFDAYRLAGGWPEWLAEARPV